MYICISDKHIFLAVKIHAYKKRKIQSILKHINYTALHTTLLPNNKWINDNKSPLCKHNLKVSINKSCTCSTNHCSGGLMYICHRSVQFSCSVVSTSFRPHGLQHARLPCPSPTPGACLNSCPLSRWCHPTISSSVVPFSFCLWSFPASVSFLVSQFFTSGGQSIGVSTSASVLPVNIQGWFPLGWTGWISLQSKGLSRVFSSTTVQKHQFFGTQLSLYQSVKTPKCLPS